jgi:hypothetical protein
MATPKLSSASIALVECFAINYAVFLRDFRLAENALFYSKHFISTKANTASVFNSNANAAITKGRYLSAAL